MHPLQSRLTLLCRNHNGSGESLVACESLVANFVIAVCFTVLTPVPFCALLPALHQMMLLLDFQCGVN